MTMINNDYMASMALRGLNKSSQVMSNAMEQLSTGNKINRSADDAAGMGITTIHKAHTRGINVSIKHASDGMTLVNSIEGAINEVTNSLLRMRELSMQSASEVKTDYDRAQMQKEINQLSSELNRISSNTEFNNIKLLNGTFNRDISVGKTSSEVVNLSVNSTDSETLGSHELYSDTYIFSNSTSSHSVAKNELNNIFSDNADYIIKGSFDENLAKVNAGHDARELKRSFDRISDQTGVFASALTRAKISSISDIGNYTFTLEGKSSSASTVTVAIENTNNLTQLKDAINAVTGSTGISASLTGDLSGVNLLQQEGYNIIVGDVTGSGNMVIDAVKKHDSGIIDVIGSSLTLNGTSINGDSALIAGQVLLSSHKAFTITPGDNKNIFSNGNTNTNSSKHKSINEIDISSQNGGTNALTIIDRAITMISAIRSELGAKSKQFAISIDNLTNISMNTDKANGLKEDANFAENTTQLAQSQIIQQSSSSMIAQANNVKNFLLSLMNLN